ncbi:WD40-repeat-containing domain protein [Scenedesmus sp. NREL 46B-D3]|nr:WD40-repeat-containing domain protein [Scenedesmus sp. NREL 46B-D3]
MQVALRPSPSLVYNNLCALGSSGLAFTHTRSGAVLQGIPTDADTKVEVKKVDTQGNSLVQSAISCTVDGQNLLVLSNEGGLQVWDDTGANLLYVWKLPRSQPASTQHADFVRGLCFTVSEAGGVLLCAGCSSGTIQVFSVAAGPVIRPTATLSRHHSNPITCLGSSYQSRRGVWAEDLGSELVSCDDQGRVCVWQVRDEQTVQCVGAVEAGQPCCSLAVRRGFVVAARVDGCVQLYGLKDRCLRSELVAASRWLSAMDIHPVKDLVVTASEDCTLGVWALPMWGQQASCLLSVCKYNERLTGAAFCGQGADSVAAIAYDVEALNVWKF